MTTKKRGSPDRLPRSLSEAHIEKTCTDFLGLDGWIGMKTDPVSNKFLGKGFGEPGMPDYQYRRYKSSSKDRAVLNGKLICGTGVPELIWIEWKKKGGKRGQHQLEWRLIEILRGGISLMAGLDFPASIEGFVEWYRTSGLQRNMGIRLK